MSQSALAIIILLIIMVCFVINKIPMGLTAVLGALLMALVGIIDFPDALSSFGSDTVMMVFGVITMGNALLETRSTEYIGKKLFNAMGAGNNERLFICAAVALAAVISAFTSNTATVAIMLPLVSSVVAVSGGRMKRKNTYMAVGIASVAGGNLTLAGSTPQLIAQGILTQTDGCRGMTFFELTRGALPIVILLIVYYATIGYKLQNKVFDFNDPQSEFTEEGDGEYNKSKMLTTTLIFVGCTICFVLELATMGVVAMIGACLCCLTGCISFKKAFHMMDWTAITVLGGSLGFAKGMESSGAGNMLAEGLLNILSALGNPSPVLVGASLILFCSVISNFISNTAVAAIVTPFAISIAKSMGIDPIPFVIMVIIASNLAFATPIGTPPMTLTLAGGYRFMDYVKVGGLYNVLAVMTAIITLPLLYSF